MQFECALLDLICETDWQKPFLETVPWLVVVFQQRWGFDEAGERLERRDYYSVRGGFVVNEDEAEEDRNTRSEADLRGSLDNDSLTEDEIRQIEEDRAKAEEAAKLREEDYQLAYAIDILKGISALGPEYAAALAAQSSN